MSHLQKIWLIFGPFHTPLWDEIDYCYECVDQGPKYYTTDPSSVDESVYCRLMLFADEEPGPDFFDKMSITARSLLEEHGAANAGSFALNGHPVPGHGFSFFLPSNYYGR